MTIQVILAPLCHQASGFMAWDAGEYQFSDDPAHAAWLQGQVERGAVRPVVSTATADAPATDATATEAPAPKRRSRKHD